MKKIVNKNNLIYYWLFNESQTSTLDMDELVESESINCGDTFEIIEETSAKDGIPINDEVQEMTPVYRCLTSHGERFMVKDDLEKWIGYTQV